MVTSKKIKIAFILCFVAFQLQAQIDNSRFSTNLMQWLHNIEVAPEKNRTAVLNKTNGIEYLSAFVKVSNAIDETQFNKLGVIVGTKAGNIWTVRIPKYNMVAFIKLSGIEYIELDRPVRQLMDSARYYTHVDSVTNGIGLNMPYTGKGVVVGISDNGFDYTHPAFYDTTYSLSRIKRVWIQSLSGNPPAGYSYGAEFTDTTSILNRKYDDTKQGSHGNMVASIAAGSGMGSKNNRLYRGVAYEADLVMVTGPTTYLDWRAMNMTTLIDGFNYTFKYAQSVGKPAVINVSLGSLVGPRDGTSLFSQACDNLTGPGKILVFAAMNLGGTKVHVKKSFTPTDTVLSTLIPNLTVDNGLHKNYIDIWGDSLKSFCLKFAMYKNGSVINSSAVYCLDNSVKDFFLIGSDNDTCYITLTTKQQENNKKPHATFEIYTKTKDTLMLSAIATNGDVHMWQEYFDTSWNTYYGAFLGNGTGLIDGDDHFTIGEVNCIKSAITVGASVSKMYWKTVNNVTLYNPTYTSHGTLAPYSSHGPDINGRMKPDITAPGGMIAGATSSYDPVFLPGGPRYSSFVVSKYVSPLNNRTYYYGIGQGTSFASPVVSGIVALMLQVNPSLSPERIKNLLYKTAFKDNFTTPSPNPALWGAGKINGYAAVKEAILTAGIISVPADEMEIKVYPNPASDMILIQYEAPKSGNFLVEITSITGQIIQTKLWQISVGINQLPFQIDSNSKGLYFVNITGNGGKMTKKILIQ